MISGRGVEFQNSAKYPGRFINDSDGAMDRDTLVTDILKDAIVGCRCPPDIVFGLQAIDGYDYVQARQIRPGRTHPSEGTGNDLHMDSARQEQGNEQLKFAIPD